MLEAKAGTTERIRGERWMKIRRAVLLAGQFTCVDCGLVHRTNEIDHDVPLEQGGSHDEANLKIRCKECHAAKTTREQRARNGR
jgi:5-methylcytosine-specific restriction protein A